MSTPDVPLSLHTQSGTHRVVGAPTGVRLGGGLIEVPGGGIATQYVLPNATTVSGMVIFRPPTYAPTMTPNPLPDYPFGYAAFDSRGAIWWTNSHAASVFVRLPDGGVNVVSLSDASPLSPDYDASVPSVIAIAPNDQVFVLTRDRRIIRIRRRSG